MQSILVTGGAGFIGSNFVRRYADRAHLIVLDKLTYAGNIGNIQELIDLKQIDFVKADICDVYAMTHAWDQFKPSHIVHFAAETHVDRSIQGSAPFIQTNVAGTQVLLDISKNHSVERYVQVSTDEVYGSLPEDRPDMLFTENSPIAPNSPYSASKTAGDCLARSYFHTFGLPVLTTRCSNNYGPYAFPEKLIPLFVTNLLEGKTVPLYGDGLNVRDWLHVEDHCDAIWEVLHRGKPGEVYNIGGNNEINNRQITETILRLMNKDWDESVTYVKDRPGHDRRYAIDASKMKRELGWSPKWTFDEGIAATIDWYRKHESWWRAVKSGEYLKYYERQYG